LFINDQLHGSEANKQVLRQEMPHVMEPEGSLPYSQEPITSLIWARWIYSHHPILFL